MKIKRCLFIMSLIFIFAICFVRMNEHYDEFSRYPYPLSENEKTRLLDCLNKDEINYMIENKLSYDIVNNFMEIESFQIKNSLWYQKAYDTREENKEYIVAFINKYKDKLNYEELDIVLSNYSYNEFVVFYDQSDHKDLKLVSNPSDLLLTLQDHESLYQYVPKDLKKLSKIKTKNIDDSKRMYLQKPAFNALKALLKDAYEINESNQGGFVVYITYLSYEQQVNLYEKQHPFIQKAGFNEYQLGYSVCLTTDEKYIEEETKDEEVIDPKNGFDYLQELQYSWLKDNAYKYGFVLRHQDETIKLDEQMYFELRYVGEDVALTMHQQQLDLEEYNNLNSK